MPRLRSLLSVAVLIVAAACSDAVGPGEEQSDLEINRQKWRNNGFTSYTMTMSRVCFCGDVGPWNVVVVKDSVVLATRVTDGRPVDARFLPTINRLFDFIDQAIKKPAAQITAQYDASRGYPREIVYDGSVNIADDELTYTLSNVAVLSTTVGIGAR
jgi:hypothetical protein